MTEIIDASVVCGPHATALAAAGVRTAIRYYSRDTLNPAKRTTRAEALQLAAAGIRLGIVHEARFGNRVTSFSRDLGVADGAYAFKYAADVMGQPAGSAIYFGVDFDATAKELTASILPYFEGVAEALASAPRAYRVGVYGSGLTCRTVLDRGLAELAWLAQSKGWAGYQTFLKSNRWALLQEMPAEIAGVDCDPDVANPAIPDFGAFDIAPPAAATQPMRVVARSGLNLRAGPGVEFPVRRTMPAHTRVLAGKRVGDWAQIDLEGDGLVDGFANVHFLEAEPV